MGMSPTLEAQRVFDYAGFVAKVAAARRVTELVAAQSPSLDGAERVRLARLARFQRSSTATRTSTGRGNR